MTQTVLIVVQSGCVASVSASHPNGVDVIVVDHDAQERSEYSNMPREGTVAYDEWDPAEETSYQDEPEDTDNNINGG